MSGLDELERLRAEARERDRTIVELKASAEKAERERDELQVRFDGIADTIGRVTGSPGMRHAGELAQSVVTVGMERDAAIEKRDREIADLRALLAECRPYVESQSDYGPSYGYFLGGDPRNFTVDPECSTDAEKAQHAADCAAWERGEETAPIVVHAEIDTTRSIARQIKGADAVVLERDAEGDVTGGHVTRAGYGLGTNAMVPEPVAIALLARIDGATK